MKLNVKMEEKLFDWWDYNMKIKERFHMIDGGGESHSILYTKWSANNRYCFIHSVVLLFVSFNTHRTETEKPGSKISSIKMY